MIFPLRSIPITKINKSPRKYMFLADILANQLHKTSSNWNSLAFLTVCPTFPSPLTFSTPIYFQQLHVFLYYKLSAVKMLAMRSTCFRSHPVSSKGLLFLCINNGFPFDFFVNLWNILDIHVCSGIKLYNSCSKVNKFTQTHYLFFIKKKCAVILQVSNHICTSLHTNMCAWTCHICSSDMMCFVPTSFKRYKHHFLINTNSKN